MQIDQNKQVMVAQWRELTDLQWEVIELILPKQVLKKHNVRTILNAIFWILRTGAQWRNLDSQFPPWQSVYYHFRRWKQAGVIEDLNAALVQLERTAVGREKLPSMGAIDSQTVKAAPLIKEAKGIDGNKRINGRKRHILVDTMGLILGVIVNAANSHDGRTACRLLHKCEPLLDRMKKVLVDGGYAGDFIAYAEAFHALEVELSSRPPTARGFVPIRWRWVVERTFGWLNFFRRLSKDYEKTVESSAAMILLANVQVILSRIK